MKILLIGHSIIDHLDEDGIENSQPGGIYYSLLGISSLVKVEDEVFLLSGWNQDTIHLFEKLYSRSNLTFANNVDEMPEVFLKTSGEGEREEVYINLSSQLSIDKISSWRQFDGILINMITGFDLSLEQLQTIRKNFPGMIYFDVHTLSRGIGEGLKRVFRPIPKIGEWLANIDILQCNGNELTSIIQNKNENESAAEIISAGVNIVIVTRGSDGAHLYFKSDGEIKSFFIDAVKINEVNKVGCGDIFGAVFFYSYISTRDVFESLKQANKAGASAASTANITLQTFLKFND